MRRKESAAAIALVAPACLALALFVLWPAARMFWISFHDTPLSVRETTSAAGLLNYRALVSDPTFTKAMKNTLVFSFFTVPIQCLLALLLAVWVNRRGVARRFLQFSVFLPTVISLAVLSVLWKLLYAPASASGAGLINGLLATVGLPSQPFLASPKQAMPAIIGMSIWQGVGFQTMIFYAALQQIPGHLYEAASIDGAGTVRRFCHVTLPGLAPTAAFVAMITAIFALKLFVQPFLMTQGGPRDATVSAVQYVYEAIFFQHNLGLACAASVVFFVVLCGIALTMRLLLRKAETLT